MARRLVDHALDWGWDDQHGGFYDKGDVFNGRAYDTTKVWWTQAEGLNALLLMHLKHGRETDRYWKAFRKQWAFIEAHMIDPVHGGWFWQTTREGTLERRHPQGHPVEGQLPHRAGPDERLDDARRDREGRPEGRRGGMNGIVEVVRRRRDPNRPHRAGGRAGRAGGTPPG